VAIKFDGTGDFISIGDAAALDFERTDAFSIEAWVNIPTPGADSTFVGKVDTSTTLRGYSFAIGSDMKTNIELYNDNGATNKLRRISTQTVVANTWTHVAFTYSGSSTAAGIKIYINGVESTYESETDSLSATILNNINLEIGRSGSGLAARILTGTMDEVRIWSDVRTIDEIKANMFRRIAGNEANLVAYWRLDDQGGGIGNTATSAIDFQENNTKSNGTINGNPLNADSAPISYGD